LMGDSDPADELRGLNRKQRRAKTKNRLFTKKGYTRVVKIGDGQPQVHVVKVGSAIDKIARHNSRKRRKLGIMSNEELKNV
jgi:hypothetical protein